MRNLFDNIPRELPAELTEILCDGGHVRIERIVSRGHSSPPGFWYDQDDREFVVLLKGRAGMAFEGQAGQVVLQPGDCLEIKAHLRHRVEWTEAGQDTVWLAVHCRERG